MKGALLILLCGITASAAFAVLAGVAIHFLAPAGPTTFVECRDWSFSEYGRCGALQRTCHDNLLRNIELCANQFGTDSNE